MKSALVASLLAVATAGGATAGGAAVGTAAAAQEKPGVLDPALGRGEGLLRALRRSPDAGFLGRLPTPPPAAARGDAPAPLRIALGLRALLESALATDPSDVGAFLDFHERVLWLGFAGDAARGAETLLASRADYPPALALLAAARLEQGRFEEAEALAAKALAGKAEPPLALCVRGCARDAAGDWAGAVADFSRAAALDPALPEAPFRHGAAAFERNRIEEAKGLLDRVLPYVPEGDSPRAAFVRSALAMAEELRGREPLKVAADFAGAAARLEMRPDIPAVRVRLGGTVVGTMVLSTGSSATVLYAAGAKAVSPRRDVAISPAAMGAAPFRAMPAVLDSLELAGAKIENVPVLASEGSQREPAGDVLGVIGLSTLRRFRVVLDGFEGALRLEPPSGPGGYRFGIGDAPGPLSAAMMPMRVSGGLLTLRGKVGEGRERAFLLDTSFRETAIDAGLLEGELGLRAGAKGVEPVELSTPAGSSLRALRARLSAPVSLKHLEFPGLTAVGVDLRGHGEVARCEVGGILGWDVLARSRVTLDFGAGQAMFETVVPQKAPPK